MRGLAGAVEDAAEQHSEDTRGLHVEVVGLDQSQMSIVITWPANHQSQRTWGWSGVSTSSSSRAARKLLSIDTAASSPSSEPDTWNWFTTSWQLES